MRRSATLCTRTLSMVIAASILGGAAVHAAQGEQTAKPATQAVPPNAAASLPAFPFRYGGQVRREGVPPMVALIDGSDTYLVAAGDLIGPRYRLEHIGTDHLTVTYLPLKQQQTIAFSNIPPDKVSTPAPSTTAPVGPAPDSPPPTSLGTRAPTCC